MLFQANHSLTVRAAEFATCGTKVKEQFYTRHLYFSTGTDCGPHCDNGKGEWYSDEYSQWGNTMSCSGVRSPEVIKNCAPDFVDVL